jgi:starvation-inducible DNA-binding protein
MTNQTDNMKTHKKLGFNSTETEKMVLALNDLLCNYQVHYQKLRNFHWNVVGSNFFELHNQFEIEYNQVKLNIDEIAERIRVFGKKPISTMSEYLSVSNIKESPSDISSTAMVEEVIKDFEILLSYMEEIIDIAGEIGDNGTEDMVTAFLKRTESRHWMFSAFNR